MWNKTGEVVNISNEILQYDRCILLETAGNIFAADIK